jgi:hypothetical protein
MRSQFATPNRAGGGHVLDWDKREDWPEGRNNTDGSTRHMVTRKHGMSSPSLKTGDRLLVSAYCVSREAANGMAPDPIEDAESA